jgi:hypothetical protein
VIHLCAWCGSVMGQKPPLDDLTRTHGVCVACHRRLLLAVRRVTEARAGGAPPSPRVYFPEREPSLPPEEAGGPAPLRGD